jgi:hypothetical protein
MNERRETRERGKPARGYRHRAEAVGENDLKLEHCTIWLTFISPRRLVSFTDLDFVREDLDEVSFFEKTGKGMEILA